MTGSPVPALAELKETNLFAPLDPAIGPDETLVRCGSRTFSRAEFWDLVGSEAQRLEKTGVEPGDRVAIATENCHVALSSFFATLAVGGVAVPLNVRLAPLELVSILEDAAPTAVLAHSDQARRLGEVLDSASIKSELLIAKTDPPRTASDWAPKKQASTIAIFYTGGSTGQPKGVQISAANYVANARHFASIVDAGPGLRYLHLPPMFHLADAGVSMLVHFTRGQHVFVGRFDPQRAVSALHEGLADWTDVVPTMLQRMLEQPFRQRDMQERLRTIIYGGAAMPEAVAKEAIECFGPVLMQTYGLSESTSLVTALTAKDHIDALEGRVDKTRLTSCGLPVSGVSVRLDDNSSEILVRSPSVMSGYWNRPDESARALRGGWLHTGDIGRWDADGYLHVVGRLREIIISGGETIYAGEVERVLREVPGVREAAVLALPDERWGERVHACVRVDSAFSREAAEATLSRELARYKHPKSWSVGSEPLPQTPIGKIDKKRLGREAIGKQADA